MNKKEFNEIWGASGMRKLVEDGKVTGGGSPALNEHLKRTGGMTNEELADPFTLESIIPCPFCGVSLENIHIPNQHHSGWAQHPLNTCLLTGYKFDEFDPEKWNARATKTITPIL